MAETPPSYFRTHATRPEFLDAFRELNPHLVEVDDYNRCANLWNLLTPQHRFSHACCSAPYYEYTDESFHDHMEMWLDRRSGMEVAVTHPPCSYEDFSAYYGPEDGLHHGRHERTLKFLATRGLSYNVSNGSWYSADACLTVVARVDVLETIQLPRTPEHSEPGQFISPTGGVDWELCARTKLAEEKLTRERMAAVPVAAEARGEFFDAVQFHCVNAFLDLTGGFDEMAHQELAEAQRILDAHPNEVACPPGDARLRKSRLDGLVYVGAIGAGRLSGKSGQQKNKIQYVREYFDGAGSHDPALA